VVLYEDVSKKRVARLVGAVRDMRAMRGALAALEKVRGAGGPVDGRKEGAKGGRGRSRHAGAAGRAAASCCL
jgi:hypothetical protein